jgi:uncharacterized protein with GYD domain
MGWVPSPPPEALFPSLFGLFSAGWEPRQFSTQLAFWAKSSNEQPAQPGQVRKCDWVSESSSNVLSRFLVGFCSSARYVSEMPAARPIAGARAATPGIKTNQENGIERRPEIPTAIDFHGSALLSVEITEGHMPTYVMLSTWTDQGIRQIKDSPDRLDAARDLCHQHGAEMTAFYMTMGAYDLVLIIDAPNDDTLASIALSLGKDGNIRTTTLKTFDEAQYREIIGSLG